MNIIAALLCFMAGFSWQSIKAQESPHILIVTAHPDDESGCAASVYKITKELKGTADLFLITNGEAGYKYSTLAENLYHARLTEEKTGRELLPSIRKKELMAGGSIIGIRNYYFQDQKDTYYTLDADTVLHQVWDTAMIQKKLAALIRQNKYEYIFCLLPTDSTHGHHKAATILALRAVRDISIPDKPIILGCTVREAADTSLNGKKVFHGLAKYPLTAINANQPAGIFDRRISFGYNNRLNYKVIVNWLIAEHKSQGTMQLAMNRGDIEEFWSFDINAKGSEDKIQALFAKMNKPPSP
jgi:LmbE family N-acetylglucosaminyl deacetylase